MGNDISVYPRKVGDHIWETEKGFFTYSDEAENFADALYSSFEEAQTALNHYADWLCYEPTPEEQAAMIADIEAQDTKALE